MDSGPNFVAEAQGATLDSLMKLFYLMLDRPVIDRTGIQGRFDIHIEFAKPEGRAVFRPLGEPDLPRPPVDPADPLAAPSIFTVVEKELGLKLEPSKGPRDFFVIDHIEKPSEN